MRCLLDTHTLLWWLFDDPRLSETARGLLMDRSNDVRVSSASAWEISTKYRLGRLDSAAPLVRDMAGWMARAGFAELAITIAHAQKAGSWPQPHRDPFDRMLAAQSVIEDIPIVGRDRALLQFGVVPLW
ncbi:MAG: type II toxin-antitoxin system VapC family toxin [Dehalococcoidia bacterium]